MNEKELSKESIFTSLQNLFREKHGNVVDAQAITVDTPFLSLNIDSMELMGLMMNIEETFNVYINDEIAFQLKTIGELVEVIQQQANKTKN